MASEKLLNALNDQFNFELLSGYYYMAMASYCSAENMNGFSHFLHEQSKEEYEHAMKLYEFINDIDGRVKMQAISEPKNDYNSFLEVFEEALSHEQLVTSKINNLLNLATEEKHYPTIQFLQWFVEEQVEEEASMKDIIFKLKGIDGKFTGLYLLDKELGKR
ncbi:ferritin [Tissierella creatinophila]|uniref:Ferritin n=1 Tax=Tissierella creatinophila DSM 6911 TaxID=1123403 RepID=A0A1U7M451_TISCR|nr:ferritin [Tissierella creatinophila]OLS02094.1 putative ferritin-1 [Tissierella creatinophila DSM 6911]